jgi:hypothetical protein
VGDGTGIPDRFHTAYTRRRLHVKRIGIVMLAVMLFAMLSMAASWTGWISDEKCGAKGGNAEHASCAKSCVKAGMAPVLAVDGGQVYKFSNPDKVKKFAGEKVEITGTETDGTIAVDSVKAAAKSGS